MQQTIEAPIESASKHEPQGRQPKPVAITDHICDQVMSRVGKVKDFLQITARLIRGRDYRINIWTQEGIGDAKVALSFFVTTDATGRITGSNPLLP